MLNVICYLLEVTFLSNTYIMLIMARVALEHVKLLIFKIFLKPWN